MFGLGWFERSRAAIYNYYMIDIKDTNTGSHIQKINTELLRHCLYLRSPGKGKFLPPDQFLGGKAVHTLDCVLLSFFGMCYPSEKRKKKKRQFNIILIFFSVILKIRHLFHIFL